MLSSEVSLWRSSNGRPRRTEQRADNEREPVHLRHGRNLEAETLAHPCRRNDEDVGSEQRGLHDLLLAALVRRLVEYLRKHAH
jgi:hypothetical protein